MNYQTLYTEIVLPQYAGMTDAEIVAALNATTQARRQVPVAALYATALATGAMWCTWSELKSFPHGRPTPSTPILLAEK